MTFGPQEQKKPAELKMKVQMMNAMWGGTVKGLSSLKGTPWEYKGKKPKKSAPRPGSGRPVKH